MSRQRFTQEEIDRYASLYQAILDDLTFCEENEPSAKVKGDFEKYITSFIVTKSQLPESNIAEKIEALSRLNELTKALVNIIKAEKKSPEKKRSKSKKQVNLQLFSDDESETPLKTIDKLDLNLFSGEALGQTLKESAISYMAMLNGTATNQLTSISTRSNPPTVDAITGTATIKQGTLKVFIENYNVLTSKLRTSTRKLLDTCIIALTKQNDYRGKTEKLNPLVTIPLEHFMGLCGVPITKPSKDKFRRKVKEDLDTLYRISMEWTETSGRKTKDFAKMRLCYKAGIVNGNIVFAFSPDMANYLNNAYLTYFPMELLKLDERNPNSYPIGKKLMLHNSIDNNKRKGTANILSVKSLLEVCPDMPTYEQVLHTGRQLDQRIKAPFETALNTLSSFIKWEYCNSKGAPLTEEQLQATDYATFEKLFIQFVVIDAPDQTARLERKAERNKKRATAKRKPKSTDRKE